MRLVTLLFLFALPAFAKSKKQEHHDAWGFIVLNSERTKVHWTDGDSFNIKEGPHTGKGTRLQGYNTLEAYGPVHSWGKWTALELFEIARGSASVAAAQEWKCSTDGKEDGYHRLLIDCPELAVHMVHEGYGMAYAVEGTKTVPAVLEAQKDAQANKRGMWRKGVSKSVVSSVHSVGEDDAEQSDHAYNRVVDTRTGEALKRLHKSKYDTCQKVCESVDGDESCMVYVPFKQRYHDPPDCLKAD
jgi:endonuclease YncB( thermonuclease family)